MSIWFMCAVFAGVLAGMLVLDAAARWNTSTGVMLDAYDRLLGHARDRASSMRNTAKRKDANAAPGSEVAPADNPPAPDTRSGG